jgi:hypothetical protein
MSGSAARDGRSAGLRRLAGPDDGRMYGTSDAGYQAKLSHLTDAEIKANTAATAAHYAAEVKLFMDGANARVGTGEQVECTAELLWLVKQQRPQQGVIAVDRWSAGMMGRAAKAVNDDLDYGVVFLGDCAKVSNLDGAKSRTSACIAQHWLQYDFPERMQRGEYNDKKKARAALKEELQEGARYLCFVDATELKLTRYDWEEAQKVSSECNTVVVVSVGCEADVPDGVMCLAPPAESTARPRAHLRARQVAAKSALTELQRQLYEDIKKILANPEDDCLDNIRKRKLDDFSALVSELGKHEHKLNPEQVHRLKKARTVIEEGGAYVSDTESEDESEQQAAAPASSSSAPRDPTAHLYREDGHYWRCCEMRCVCPNSTGIGAGSKSKLWG